MLKMLSNPLRPVNQPPSFVIVKVGQTGFVNQATLRNSPPAARCTTGDSKDVSPSNSWNDTKSAVLRQLPQATLAPVRGSGVGNKEHPTPLCLSVLPPHPKRVVPTHPQRVIPTTPLWVYRHTPCRYYRHTLRWYYRQPPRGYYRKRQRGREIARRRSWERYIDV